MQRQLPANIWFVRSNGGSGSYPVKPEGWRIYRHFIGGVAVSAAVALVLALTVPGWLWSAAFAAGVVFSAAYLIATVRKHTDYSITYNDYMKDR